MKLQLFTVLALAGCAGAKQDAAGLSYEAQHLACVDENSTKATIDACRDDVRRRWGRLDAGALTVPSKVVNEYPYGDGGDQ